MIILIIIYLLIALWSCFEGLKDFIMISKYFEEINEHLILWASRALVVTMICFAILYGKIVEISILKIAIFGIASGLQFPFYHNGTYYVSWQIIKKHPKYNIKSKSEHTDAKMNFSFKQRTIMLVLSILLLILINLVI